MSTAPATPLIIFSHGNSFPGGTYSQFFKSMRARGYHIKAIDRFGHEPRYAVTSNWPHLVQQLHDFASQEMQSAGQDAWLVGHSLGGIVSLLCAAKHPVLGGQRVKGLLLLDSPVLTGWKAKALAASKITQLIGAVSPGRISSKRRNTWPSRADALAHLGKKRVFKRWDPLALADYMEHGFEDVVDDSGNTHCVLRFDRDVETQIYNTLPHNVDAMLRRHPLQCPMSFIAGTESVEMHHVGEGLSRRLVGTDAPGRWQHIAGSHLFPMESPKETATASVLALQAMEAMEAGSA
jgi:pimeloyl-ACP methyl ester carboxylesterase